MKDVSGREIRVGAWVVCAEGDRLDFGLVVTFYAWGRVRVQCARRITGELPERLLVLEIGQVPHHVARAVGDAQADEIASGARVAGRLGA